MRIKSGYGTLNVPPIKITVAMLKILHEDTIVKYILPHLSKAKRGFVSRSQLWQVVNAIFYKFKSGVQWRLLPSSALFDTYQLSWNAVYHHFRKWCRDGSWRKVWMNLLRDFRHLLCLSTVQLDGTLTRGIRGGQHVGVQSRRKMRCTNTLWLCDAKGRVVGFTTPQAGNHQDVFSIDSLLSAALDEIRQCKIAIEGWFLNADGTFDCKALRKLCFQYGIQLNTPFNKRRWWRKTFRDTDDPFDELMYQDRKVIEHMNSWMDNYRSFLIRFDTSLLSWKNWHYVFCILFWCKRLKV